MLLITDRRNIPLTAGGAILAVLQLRGQSSCSEGVDRCDGSSGH